MRRREEPSPADFRSQTGLPYYLCLLSRSRPTTERIAKGDATLHRVCPPLYAQRQLFNNASVGALFGSSGFAYPHFKVFPTLTGG